MVGRLARRIEARYAIRLPRTIRTLGERGARGSRGCRGRGVSPRRTRRPLVGSQLLNL